MARGGGSMRTRKMARLTGGRRARSGFALRTLCLPPSRVRSAAPQPSGPRDPRGRFRRPAAPTAPDGGRAAAAQSHRPRPRCLLAAQAARPRCRQAPRSSSRRSPDAPLYLRVSLTQNGAEGGSEAPPPHPLPSPPALRARCPAPRPTAPPPAHSRPVRFASGPLTEPWPPDVDATTRPQPGPASGRKGERTAPDRGP